MRDVGLEARGVAGLEHGLAVVLDQHDFAFENIDEFVFLFVPVPQRRGRARLERRQIDAELVEAGGIAEPLARAAGDHAIERLPDSSVRLSIGKLAMSIFGMPRAPSSASRSAREKITPAR